jgi:hypothetical protein
VFLRVSVCFLATKRDVTKVALEAARPSLDVALMVSVDEKRGPRRWRWS